MELGAIQNAATASLYCTLACSSSIDINTSGQYNCRGKYISHHNKFYQCVFSYFKIYILKSEFAKEKVKIVVNYF
jgi:hypothetical protein